MPDWKKRDWKKRDWKKHDWKKLDWKKLVRERVSSPNSAGRLHEDVIAELAAHLEETYEAARAQGLNETEAVKLALQEAGDWNVLGKNIERARSAKEPPMNHRTKTLWLPSLASFAAASLFLLVLTHISLQPRFLVRLPGLGRSFYIEWLGAQILFGALGAFLSRRAGGTRTARIVAGTFPALVQFGLWALLDPRQRSARAQRFRRGPSSVLRFRDFRVGGATRICAAVGRSPIPETADAAEPASSLAAA